MAIDDKTAAAVWRNFIKSLETTGGNVREINERADKYDPPEPEITGAHVWVRYAGGLWIPGTLNAVGDTIYDADGGYHYVNDPDVETRPACTLEPGQMAVNKGTVEDAEGLLRIENYIITANKLRIALDRDKEVGNA